jgi:hypothetical protein
MQNLNEKWCNKEKIPLTIYQTSEKKQKDISIFKTFVFLHISYHCI